MAEPKLSKTGSQGILELNQNRLSMESKPSYNTELASR